MWLDSTKRNPTSGDVPACLCKVVMGFIPEAPRIGFTRATQEFVMYCPACLIRTYPSTNKHSVVAEWCGMNRRGDEHIETLWREKYELQQGNLQAAN